MSGFRQRGGRFRATVALVGALSVLGLSDDEQLVYESLAARGSGSLQQISSWTGLSSRVTRPALDGLQLRGLIDVLVGAERRWTPTPPEPALDALVRGQELELAKVRAHAQAIAERLRHVTIGRRPDELVSIAEGAAAVGAHYEQLQRIATKEVLIFDRPPYPHTEGIAPNSVQAERIRAGVSYRTVYDTVILNDPAILARVQVDLATGEQARTLTGVPLKLAIGDRSLALVPLAQGSDSAEVQATLVIRPSVLLDSLAGLFEALWQRAIPLLIGATNTTADTDDLVEVVRLLATGMTDARIARHLNTSERTVARKVAAAMDHLGATTRFQAGMLAQQRGWLSP